MRANAQPVRAAPVSESKTRIERTVVVHMTLYMVSWGSLMASLGSMSVATPLAAHTATAYDRKKIKRLPMGMASAGEKADRIMR